MKNQVVSILLFVILWKLIMAELTIQKYELNKNFMPPICVVCGKHSNEYIEKSIVKISPLVYFLPGFIRGIATRAHRDHTPSIDMPLCGFHSLLEDLRSILSFLAFFLMLAGLIFLLSCLGARDSGSLMFSFLVGFVSIASAFIIAIWSAKAITIPIQVSDNYDATYDGFHETFLTEFLRRRQLNIDDAKKRAQS